ncbi:hypothetical protein [Reyranella sp. CPCC 100927]|uniref:hypothetical protein n=1 Tax=Reyranella sp. CPCC 100927 TaxID=2599616 RepID=UPI0011B7C2A6|nr:hypothetical protein [Reyranella sp. CPCC 100927]TWT13069.1 hypothetical protein FQU96_12595 [Reyranella sp. CPCC 100927]
MDSIAAALANPTVYWTYFALCFAVLVLPMIALAWWYHANIHKTPGGRALMRRQYEVGVSRRPTDAGRMLRAAVEMGGDIESDVYGAPVRRMQHRVYVVTGVWLAMVAVMFGILIWADTVNHATG